MRWLLLLVAACGASKETCTTAACPTGGNSYRFCSGGGATACRYAAGDGSSFACKSCSDCGSAANQITSWCSRNSTGGTTGAPMDGGPASGTCLLPRQDCGGGKCVPTFNGQSWSGICVADGTVGAGLPCTLDTSNPNTTNDDCRAGLVCDDLFGNAARICRKLCASDGECAGGERCGDFLFAAGGWGWCAPTCTPFSSAAGNCPAAMDCGENVDDAQQPGGETGFFLCKKTGSGGAFATCMSDADCGPNLWCGYLDNTGTNSGCLPNCNSNQPCPMPDGGALTLTCHGLMSQPLDAGYCSPF